MDHTKHSILSSLQDKEDDVDELKYSAEDFDSLTVADLYDIEIAMQDFLNDINLKITKCDLTKIHMTLISMGNAEECLVKVPVQ